jgi:signal peptidase I
MEKLESQKKDSYRSNMGCDIMKGKKTWIREFFESIIIAVVIAFLIENYIIGFAITQGRSMYPTLNTDDRLVIMKLSYWFEEPKAGDIIIFNPPDSGHRELFVKRIIASEYDRFYIEKGHLYVNDKKVSEAYVHKEEYWNRNYPFDKGVVPPNMVFVMGDNRNDSNDSRSFGFVTKDRIKGKVILKIWPLNHMRAFINSG